MKPTPATTPPCVECGEPVEDERVIYARPTCFACLPPPEPLPETRPIQSDRFRRTR